MADEQYSSRWRRALEFARRRPAVAWAGGVGALLAVAVIIGLINRQPPAPVLVPPAAPDPLATGAGQASPTPAPSAAPPAALAPAAPTSQPAAPAAPSLALRPPAYPLDAPMQPGAVETLELDRDNNAYDRVQSWVEVATRQDEASPAPAVITSGGSRSAFARLGWPNSRSQVRVARDGYLRVERSDTYALVLTAQGRGVLGCVVGLPSADSPDAEVENWPPGEPQVGVGQAALAAGYHRVQLRCLMRGEREGDGRAELALRAPGGVPEVVSLYQPAPAPAPEPADAATEAAPEAAPDAGDATDA